MYILIILFIVVIGYIPAIILYYYIKSYVSYKIGYYTLVKKFGPMSAKVAKYKFPPVAFKDILLCFSNHREDRYNYLGISWNIFREGTDLHEYLEEFIMFVAKKAKPWWCPTFVLNLLNLFANDKLILNTILKRIDEDGTTYQNECNRILKAIKSPYEKNKIKAALERIDSHVKQTLK